MKHTLKAKYAANGLTAHRQRQIAQVPEAVRRAQEKVRLAEITERLTSKPDDFTNDYRRAAKASIANFFSGQFNKVLFNQLKAFNIRRPAQYQSISGRSADMIIMDDLVRDDMMDATAFAFRHFAGLPAVRNDFGVIQVNATC